MTQRRARIGGEIGNNGEWYEGGKFIANTDRAKGRKVSYVATRRQLIEPGVLEVAPEDDLVAIFPQLSVGFFAFDRDANRFGEVVNEVALSYYGGERLIDLKDRYNNGERWTRKGS